MTDTPLVTSSRDALDKALDAGIREWEDSGGPLQAIVSRHLSGVVRAVDTLADDETSRETVSAEVHKAWMETKRAQGIESRPSEWGEEQMVPYSDLSERAKDLDRASVVAVLRALAAALDAR